jgi:hypothetical protein
MRLQINVKLICNSLRAKTGLGISSSWPDAAKPLTYFRQSLQLTKRSDGSWWIAIWTFAQPSPNMPYDIRASRPRVHTWEGAHCYIAAGIGWTTAIERTELRSNGTWDDCPMRANYHVYFSPKAVPWVQSRRHPIIVESPNPPQHGGTIGWSAGSYMETLTLAVTRVISNKCTDIKGGGSGRIRHGRKSAALQCTGPAGLVAHPSGRLKTAAQIVKAELG